MIRKHHNQLKGDVVEALQFIKCLLWNYLIYHELQPSSILEQVLEGVPEDDKDSELVDDPAGWKDLFIDVETEYED